MKLISWNVNGIRAIVGKDFAENVAKLNADVICIQETKAQDDQVKTVISDLGYHLFTNSAERKGYSGTTILSKKDPMSVSNGIVSFYFLQMELLFLFPYLAVSSTFVAYAFLNIVNNYHKNPESQHLL